MCVRSAARLCSLSFVFTGRFFLLCVPQLNYETKDIFLQLVDTAVNVLFDDKFALPCCCLRGSFGGLPCSSNSDNRKTCSLDELSSAVKLVFKGGARGCVETSQFYRVHVSKLQTS